jgi:Arc/MetJ-type ribon-helix-helix transcriptional regulator
MNTLVGGRLDLAEFEKFQRIKRTKELKSNSEVIRFLVREYEKVDMDLTHIKILFNRIENKIDAIESRTKANNAAGPEKNSSSNTDDLIKTILKIVIRIAESNPRAFIRLQEDFPDMFQA